MNNVRAMLPFFVIGAFGLRRWEVWRSWRIGLPFLLVYFLFVFLQGDIWQNGLSFYGKQSTWETFFLDAKALFLYFARLANGFVGSLGVMWFLHKSMKCFSWFRILAPLGMTTLWIYILHQWLLARLLDLGLVLQSYEEIGLCVVLLLLFCHIVGCLTTRTQNWFNLKLKTSWWKKS